MTTVLTRTRSATVVALVFTLFGCGLKGALQIPERSTNVVIRGPQAAGTGTTSPQDTTTQPGDTSGRPPSTSTAPSTGTPTPALPDDADRLPPPPLPRGDSGSAQGG